MVSWIFPRFCHLLRMDVLGSQFGIDKTQNFEFSPDGGKLCEIPQHWSSNPIPMKAKADFLKLDQFWHQDFFLNSRPHPPTSCVSGEKSWWYVWAAKKANQDEIPGKHKENLAAKTTVTNINLEQNGCKDCLSEYNVCINTHICI